MVSSGRLRQDRGEVRAKIHRGAHEIGGNCVELEAAAAQVSPVLPELPPSPSDDRLGLDEDQHRGGRAATRSKSLRRQ